MQTLFADSTLKKPDKHLSHNNLPNKECSHRNNIATQTCVVNGVSFFLFIVLSSIVSGTDKLIILLMREQTQFQNSAFIKRTITLYENKNHYT